VLDVEPDAMLYPTMRGWGPDTTIEQRYSHVVALARAGVLGTTIVDLGPINVAPVDASGLPEPTDVMYLCTFGDIDYEFHVARDIGLPISLAVFEPGHLRAGLAYIKNGFAPPGSMIKFFFESAPPSASPPGPAADPLGTGRVTSPCWRASTSPGWPPSTGAPLLEPGFHRLVLEAGGHLSVGIERTGRGGTPRNVDLVTQAAELCLDCGRPPAHPRRDTGCPRPEARLALTRPGGRAEPDGELRRAPQQGTGPPGDLLAVASQLHVGEAAQQRPDGDLGLHPGQRRPEAEVDAVAEGQMGVLLPATSNRSASSKRCGSRLAAVSMATTTLPAGITTPSTSTSSLAMRRVDCMTGPMNRSISSTATRSSSGSSWSRARCSGQSNRARTELPIRLPVVSWPAARTTMSMASSSCSLRRPPSSRAVRRALTRSGWASGASSGRMVLRRSR